MFSTADSEDISQVTSLKEKSPNSFSDAQVSDPNTQPAKQPNRELTLKMLLKELVICVALALTTYGALHNTPTKVSNHPQAERFFLPDAPVLDWYRGQLTKALTIINRHDIAFVMYYAPWDAECQYVREEFELVAKVLNDRVHFSAINCWHPGSECRLRNSKISSWPVIMVYTINSRGILYKGSKDAHSMVKFLELIMTPLRRVSSAEDLVNLLSTCEAVAVGYTPLIDSPKYYNIWNSVAMHIREYDTFGEICFASVTSEELAVDLGVEVVPSARLMLWNETKDYEADVQTWNESALLHWLLVEFSQPVHKIFPLWKKSFNFERFAHGPILILFTPVNPLFEQLPIYSLLHEIALEYYDCKDNQWTKELIKLKQIQRLLYQQKNAKKFCHDYKIKQALKKPTLHYNYEVLSQQNKYPWTNSTVKNHKNGLFEFFLSRGLAISNVLRSGEDETIMSPLNLVQECNKKVLPAEKDYYENHEQCHTLQSLLKYERKFMEILETTMLPEHGDPLSADHLMQEHVKHYCKLLTFAYERGPPIYPAKDSDENITQIHGLSCRTNYTLQMAVLDSRQNHHFAESLGIDIVNRKDMTALVILDSKHESQYLLTEDFSAKSVRDFIINFSNKTLKRMLRTRVEDAVHTHFFESDNKKGTRAVMEEGSSLEITDLTTSTFRKFVRKPGAVSIVCVCGGGCSGLVTRAALTAARLLSTCGVRTRVARLDGLRHDLPWQYTPHTYPTVLVFPADGCGEAETDSRASPSDQRVSAAGLMALALRSLSPPHHLRVRLALCYIIHAIQERITCLTDLREHVTTLIGRNLKYWRRSNDINFQYIIFKRLQHLHRVSFELNLLYQSDLYPESQKHASLNNSLNILAKNWDFNGVSFKKKFSEKLKGGFL